VLPLWSLWSVAAHAADCAEPYTIDGMLEDLVAIETFLRHNDDPNAGKAAEALRTGLACMNEVLPRMIVGRTLRAVGAGLVAGGDAATGEDWLRTAAELEQSFEFGLEDLSDEHPVRAVYATARSTSEGDDLAVEGAGLASGTVYLDGRKITAPAARIDRWHIVQFDDGSSVRSWVIEGNRFPDAILISAAPAEVPRTKREKAPKPQPAAVANTGRTNKPNTGVKPISNNGTVTGVRDRPWEKTPLMVGGGVVIGGAGAVYYLSSVAHRQFEDANDADVLPGLQRKTNRLVIASLAVLAVGSSTLTWGVILDGDGPPLPALRVRF
jgi:hypothetical protein